MAIEIYMCARGSGKTLLINKIKTKMRNGEIKMSENTNVVEAVELATVVGEAKPKRTRRPAVVKTVTAAEIIAEVNTLTTEVGQLETAIQTIDSTNIIYQLAEKELNGKRKELADALDSVYKI